MEKLKPQAKRERQEAIQESKMAYRALDRNKEKTILVTFTPEQQAEIKQKQQTLSSLAYFIGKDFRIPVELNNPGAGWHWDFESNVIRIDPKTLLERPMDELRYLMCHEGGHRRVSRLDLIPLEEWRQPGFSAMTNFIEDPRNDNFVEESYPKYGENIDAAWGSFFENDKQKMEDLAMQKLGAKPKFMQAGYEYIRHWFNERKGKKVEIAEDLPEEVKAVVSATLESARDSWWRYPSRQEADGGGEIGRKKVDGEAMIRKYAQTSYEINRDEIWPKFKKLIEADMEDQKMQELLKDMQKEQEQQERGEGGGGQNLPQELKDKLTPGEQEALEEAIKKAIEGAQKEKEQAQAPLPSEASAQAGAQKGKGEKAEGEEGAQPSKAEAPAGKPIDLRTLPEELKQKIKDYIESLPKEQQKEIAEKAKATLKEFEDALNEEIQGKLSDNPEKKTERGEAPAEETKQPEHKGKSWQEEEKGREEEAKERRKRIESLFEDGEKDPYHEALEKVSDLIDSLTADMRDIFTKRKIEKYESGYRSGRRWNIRQRIREKVAGIPLFKTEAREQRESESEEMDYAITILVDLSGSMQRSGKIQEAFKSVVVLSETLSNLGIKFEILGIQLETLEFKLFEERLGDSVCEKLNQMLTLVDESRLEQERGGRGGNDDPTVLREASSHLATQAERNKFLIVISDGEPGINIGNHTIVDLDRELREAVAEISTNTNQKLIGLGLNSQAVAKYYENHIAGITTEEMVETLGELLREVIEKY